MNLKDGEKLDTHHYLPPKTLNTKMVLKQKTIFLRGNWKSQFLIDYENLSIDEMN